MKRAKKILVWLLAMVMVIGTCLPVSAAAPGSAVNLAITSIVTTNGDGKAVGSVTLYTNPLPNDTSSKVNVAFTWSTKGLSDSQIAVAEPDGVRVTSSNRAVVNVSGVSYGKDAAQTGAKAGTRTKTGTITLIPVSNGKATITITEKTSAKKKTTKKINVTVKTWADDIRVDGAQAVQDEEGNTTLTMDVAVNGGKRNLNAYVNGNASDQKLKYVVDPTDKKNISVDGKGNVTVKKTDGGTVTITSNDKRVEKTVTINPVASVVDNISFIADASDVKEKDLADGKLNVTKNKYTLKMKANTASDAYTYMLRTKGYEAKDLAYASNKPAVAAVDPKTGEITAKGNGTATITVTPKLGNKKSASVTVKVTTDVEAINVASDHFTIIANNKDMAQIAGVTNSGASNKAVVYKISKVYTSSTDVNGITDAKEIKKYASVDGKGNVKAKLPCEIRVDVASKANQGLSREVTVKAIDAVGKITLAAKSGSTAAVTGNKATVCRTDSAETTDKLTLEATFYSDAKGTVKIDPEKTEKSVIWSSSKPAVASVNPETGEVTANGNGTANITATATDGSGKKAAFSVTVKTDAYEILVAKAQSVSGNDIVYVEGETGKEKSYSVSGSIKASTNADASNKKLAYSVSSVKLEPGKFEDIKITANDTRAHLADGKAVERVIRLECVNKGNVAQNNDDFEITLDPTEKELKVGDTVKVSAIVTVKDGMTATDLSNVTWKSAAAGVASVAKDGTITAKKAGDTTITATYKYGKNVTKTADFKVYVGRKDADILKDVNNAFTQELKTENRDFTGVSTTFNTKSNSFAVKVIDPSKDFTVLKQTGIVEAIENLVKYSEINYSGILVTDFETGNRWTAERSGREIQVTNGVGNVLTKTTDAGEAFAAIMADSANGSLLQDWNGKSYGIMLTVQEKPAASAKTYTYDLLYTLDITMDSGYFNQQIANAFEAAMKELESANVSGISFKYDGSNLDAVITDADVTLEEVNAQREAIVKAIEDVFGKAVSVSYAIETKSGKEAGYKERTEANSDSEFVNGMLDDYMEKLAGKKITKLGDMDGSVAAAEVTYQVGNVSYVQNYIVKFYMSEAAFDKVADKALAEAVGDGSFDFGKVAYDKDSNTLSVDISGSYSSKGIADINGSAIKDVLNAMIATPYVDEDTEVTINVGDKTSNVTAKEGGSAILEKLAVGIKTLADLDGKDASIKVPYAAVNGSKRAVVYVIKFTVEEPEEETTEGTTETAGETETESESTTETGSETETESESTTETEGESESESESTTETGSESESESESTTESESESEGTTETESESESESESATESVSEPESETTTETVTE